MHTHTVQFAIYDHAHVQFLYTQRSYYASINPDRIYILDYRFYCIYMHAFMHACMHGNFANIIIYIYSQISLS